MLRGKESAALGEQVELSLPVSWNTCLLLMSWWPGPWHCMWSVRGWGRLLSMWGEYVNLHISERGSMRSQAAISSDHLFQQSQIHWSCSYWIPTPIQRPGFQIWWIWVELGSKLFYFISYLILEKSCTIGELDAGPSTSQPSYLSSPSVWKTDLEQRSS